MKARLACFTAMAALCVAVVLGGCSSSSDGGSALRVKGTVDSRAVAGAGSNDPVVIDPTQVTEVELVVTNDGDSDVAVRRARLFGRAFGLTFVAYDALVDVPVAAGESVVIEVPVEFIDLEHQATGLLPGGFAVYSAERDLLGEQEFVIDFRGSATSAMGLLGIFVVLATVLGVVGIVIAVRKGTLGASRIRRALRFGAVGLGVGASSVVALAVFRVLAPAGAVWVPLIAVPMIIGAVLGYVSPGPFSLDDEELGDELEEAGAGRPDPVAPAPAGPPSWTGGGPVNSEVTPQVASGQVPEVAEQADRSTQA